MRFCRICGTTIYHTAEARPGFSSIAGGTFDDPSWFRIDTHIRVRSKLPWVTVSEGVPAFQKGFVANPPPELKTR